MSSERDLFEAILDNPDDIALRLIYADWCDERGDPRGEFIRIQCELATAEGPPIQFRALRQREAELLTEHRRRWNGEIHRRLAKTPLANRVHSRGGGIRRWEYYCGFVEFAVVEARAFVQYPEAIFQIGPLRSVRILHAQDEIPQVMASPYLARLKQVELNLPNHRADRAENLINRHRTNAHRHLYIQPVSCISGTIPNRTYAPVGSSMFHSRPTMLQSAMGPEDEEYDEHFETDENAWFPKLLWIFLVLFYCVTILRGCISTTRAGDAIAFPLLFHHAERMARR